MIGVAISGKLASGKTTAAQALIDELGFTRVLLAGALKESAHKIADWIGETFGHSAMWPNESQFLQNIVDCMKDKSTPEGRRWLQWLGTDWGRALIGDIWIQAMMARIRREGLVRVVVDDVRFRNEVEALHAAGFLMLRIEVTPEVQRERVARIYPAYGPEVFEHPSETDLDGYGLWDYTINGQATVGQFQVAVLSTVQAWIEHPLAATVEDALLMARDAESDPQEVFDGQGT